MDRMGTELAMRDAESLQKARSKYVEDVQFFQVIQYWFYSQWDKLKTYCNNNGISSSVICRSMFPMTA